MKKKNVILLILFLILAGTAFYLYPKLSRKNSTGDNPFMQFAVEDTASVSKITIQDRNGNVALLERKNNSSDWTINKKYAARKDVIKLLLECFHDIRVRGNVPSKMRDNMLAVMTTSAKEVKIYGKNNELLKTYYVGPNTQDHMGTIMLLETPEDGRSEEPYITHIEGFTGFLNPRFFIDEMEWRSTDIFYYPNNDIAEIEVLHMTDPGSSFKLSYLGNNKLKFERNLNGALTPFAQLDTALAFDLLKRMRKVNLETYNTLLKPESADSIKNIAPTFVLKVKNSEGNITSLSLYLKKAKEMTPDATGQLTPFDPEYFWAKTDANELGLAQFFVFEPLLQPARFYGR
jgi:hypothetical protein